MKKSFLFLLVVFFFTGSLFAQYHSYRVQKHESLKDLAQKFNVSKAAILKLNPDLTSGNLAGKVIVIPSSETTENTPNSSVVRFKEYHVKKKETLYSLAKRNHISIEDIKHYNPYLYKNELGENDMIRIPIFTDGYKYYNASVQTSTFKNLIHIVLPKETKYGIAKKYGMTVAQLDSLNPQIKELKPGQVLRVTNPTIKKHAQGQYSYYEVAPKETLYSLTRKLGISKDSLEALNPVLKELGLQKGMELKIPRKTGSLSTNKLTLDLYNFSPKNIAIMLPFKLNQFKTSEHSKQTVLKNDLVLQYALDMYSGIKMAIDSAGKLGIPVNARVFDTQGSTQKVAQILRQNDFSNTQFIIGPLLSKNVETAARILTNNSLIFSPLTNSDMQGSNQIVQTRPSSMVKEEVLMTYLDHKKEGKNILVLTDKEHQLFTNKILAHFAGAKLVTREKVDYLKQSDLEKLLDKNRPNWVIMETDDYGDVINAVSYLNTLHTRYKIRVFTSDKNQYYDDVPNIFLSHLNFTYTSVNKTGFYKKDNSFVKAYIQKYGITPDSYAIRGFDVTFDALLRSASARDISDAINKQTGTTEYVGNRFHYTKKLIGGYFNNAVFLIKYAPNLQLKVLN